ncbi:two-partner secretion domain-containing protein, partial [Oceanivirga salmonicida]|uniref:two-partner secretion domain-containing protein n=1 Tax=Oceanivirga salmonicida TaxID=1769291 RepID=UPI0012E2F5F5
MLTKSKVLPITLFFGAVLVLHADIVVDNDTDAYLKEKNGTKIVNIATPTKKGVSHSKFKNFSVDKNGAVI